MKQAVRSVIRSKAPKLITPLCIALISFFAGAIFAPRLISPKAVKADTHPVFELMIYHTLPGKVPALESIFRNVSKLQSQHNLKAVGYWVTEDTTPAWKDTFVYVVAHPSKADAEKNWNALHADPAFQPYFNAAAPLIQQVNGSYNVDEIYMRPTDYSETK